jgi:ribonucleoside-diphosphate reductase alpha chain
MTSAPTRKRLPNRRGSEIFDFESMGMRFTASVGRYDDGRIAELFIDNHKAGSAIGTLVRDAGIILSFALQHGADAEAIRRALCRDGSGNARGPLGVALDLLREQSNQAGAI